MAGIDFKKWQPRVILAVIVLFIIVAGVLFVTPIFGLNITPGSTQGSSTIGGWFGELMPTLPRGYAGG